MSRRRREKTPAQYLKLGKLFVTKGLEQLEPDNATRLRLADLAAELAFIAGALERRGNGT